MKSLKHFSWGLFIMTTVAIAPHDGIASCKVWMSKITTGSYYPLLTLGSNMSMPIDVCSFAVCQGKEGTVVQLKYNSIAYHEFISGVTFTVAKIPSPLIFEKKKTDAENRMEVEASPDLSRVSSVKLSKRGLWQNQPIQEKITCSDFEATKGIHELSDITQMMLSATNGLPKNHALQAPQTLDIPIEISEESIWNGVKMTVEAVREGIRLFYANEIAEGRPAKYLKELDTAKNGRASPNNGFFGFALYQPVTYSEWTKNGNTYTYQYNGKQKSFTYRPEKGSFE